MDPEVMLEAAMRLRELYPDDGDFEEAMARLQAEAAAPETPEDAT